MKVIVIGTGSIGLRHAEVLKGAGHDVTLLPMRAERRRELEAEGWTCAASAATAVSSGVTHGIVASNTSLHVRHALELVRLGIAVLVEKPLCLSLQDSTELAKEACDRRSSIFCGLTLRFSESLRFFRQAVPRVGRLHAVDIECRSWLPGWRPGTDYRACYSASSAEGGVLRDLVHEIDYAGWIFGWPKKVFAQMAYSGRLGIQSEEQALLQYQVEDSVPVRIALDYLSRPPRRQCVARGSLGSLTWDGLKGSVLWEPAEGEPELKLFPQERNAMLLGQDAAFLRGEASELVGLEESLQSIAVCDAARKSHESGQVVLVEEPGFWAN